MDAKRLIGAGNALPWRLKSDLRRFRKITMNHPLIMGRNTFESNTEDYRSRRDCGDRA